MLKGYSKFLDVLEKGEKLILSVSFAIMLFAMLYQVVLRYVFSASNSWSEELTRYLFAFNVLIASSIAIRKDNHLQIDILISHLKPRVKCVFTIVATLAGMVFLCFLLGYSFMLCNTATNNVSAGLHIPMSIPYASIPLGTVLMLLTSLEVVLKNVAQLSNRGEEETA